MGCYGNRDVRTPNLDQLARDGIVFEKHDVTTAICMASRASLMKQMVEYRTGCNFEQGPLPSQSWDRSYPVLLRKSGYEVGFAGKFGFLVAKQPGESGTLPVESFDCWDSA